MSVYTHLTDDQFAAFCHTFGVSFQKAVPITQGIKNSNWFIQTTDDNDGEYSYVFTLFEERPPEDIQKMAIILNSLQGSLPVAAPLAKQTTVADEVKPEYLISYENKAITLVPCLAGSHPTKTSTAICRTMGEALAILHTTLQSLTPAEDYGVELYPWDRVRDREIKFMPADEADLMRDIWHAYDNLPLAELPSGLCHLDMFADNTLWDLSDNKEELTGLLDFTEVSVEHYVMDIAITINDFCTTWGDAGDGESVNFDKDKMQAFLSGYNSKRPLTEQENQALPIMLAMAAVTFWLLRLNVIYYNREQGRTGDNIMVKNPDLMKRLAAYHWGEAERLRGNGQRVYVLTYHAANDSDDNDDQLPSTQTLGVFISEQEAKAAINRLQYRATFRDYVDGFKIQSYALGQVATEL